MKVLVLNCGSSSIKFQLIKMPEEEVLIQGNYERVGTDESFVTIKINGTKEKFEIKALNHEEGIEVILNKLLEPKYNILNDLSEISAVGHRIVHGGENFTHSVLVDDEVVKELERVLELAPLHNFGALAGILAMRKKLPNTPMVTVFDTAFHQTMPPVAYIYNIPYKYYENNAIRKYGFHGTSHRYVSERVSEILGKNKEDLNIISCHLGQGASICAIERGKSIDTSMGLTPLGGIPMGSRSGNLDPSIVSAIAKIERVDADVVVNQILNKESGAYGISGISQDFRDIEDVAADGHERAKLALDSNVYLTAQTIAGYAAILGHVDVIAFAGGVGENGEDTRMNICNYLKIFGVELDEVLNDTKSDERKISTNKSKIQVWIIPTNEEIMIARDTVEISGLNK